MTHISWNNRVRDKELPAHVSNSKYLIESRLDYDRDIRRNCSNEILLYIFWKRRKLCNSYCTAFCNLISKYLLCFLNSLDSWLQDLISNLNFKVTERYLAMNWLNKLHFRRVCTFIHIVLSCNDLGNIVFNCNLNICFEKRYYHTPFLEERSDLALYLVSVNIHD